ncbi:copper amine oxidase N-terminal domain-containing protein [Paenibacillus rhizovicinus]|uniref:Copper amine oxidase N-terminal domain-containing protein n=1 Tax=Paenibacillus rhizovicinus TaxID=2704463 RepID=A0A6C0P260_9BACL|nr:copper amine oxidase N-terminal domain-containing protein [Paenibacillus rhizovicinus]QHW32441.1 copper amine oxidase N-terminal domain-containing protein [Paenibacillus rhizovicinus]
MKAFQRLSLSLVMTASLLAPGLAGTTAAAGGSPGSAAVSYSVLLKINQYYVLYTTPDVPYFDTQQRLMLPLRAVSELIGSKVGYDSASKKATVAWEGQTVEVTLNSKRVAYNGKETKLDTVPVLKNGQLFVPVRALLNGLHIKSTFRDYLLTMTDERFYKSSKLLSELEASGGISPSGSPASTAEPSAIRPRAVTLTPPKPGTETSTVTIRSENVSGYDLPAGAENLQPIFVWDNGKWAFADAARARPPVTASNTYKLSFPVGQANGSLKYVLAVGGMIGERHADSD